MSVFPPFRPLLAGTCLLAAATLAPAGCGPENPTTNAPFIPVLSYRVGLPGEPPGPDGRRVSHDAFAEHMAWLAENGYGTATVGQLAAYMRGDLTLAPRTVVIVIERAWHVAESAAAVLDRHGLAATFFLSPAVDSERELSALDWRSLRTLADHPAFELGAETRPLRDGEDLVGWLEGTVAGRGPPDVVWEVEVTRQLLETGIGRPIRSFSWPEGRTNEALVQLASKAGYTALLGRRQVVNHPGGDPLAIGRYPVLATFGTQELARLAEGAVITDVSELRGPEPLSSDSAVAAPEDAAAAPPG